METLYGILSDCHTSSPLVVESALKQLQAAGAQRLILNGDITGERNQHSIPSPYFLQYILKAAADTNLETYVQFGSHEEFLPSQQVLAHHAKLYGNIIDVARQPQIELPDHHLLFLPGSDVNASGEYTLGTDLPTGTYFKTKEGLMKIENSQQYKLCAQLIQEGQAEGMLHYENINDLREHVTAPEKTIFICHVPPLTHRPNGIDYAHFIQHHEFDFEYEKDRLDITKFRKFHNTTSVAPYDQRIIAHLQQQNIPFVPLAQNAPATIERLAREQSQKTKQKKVTLAVETTDNRGNTDLAEILRELEITKVISGHFHEAAHHAHTHLGQPLGQGTFSPSLFWNASYMDGLKAGILKVNGINVAYQNIEIKK